MFKKGFLVLLIAAMAIGFSVDVEAKTLSQELSGKILLQVEENGEAWYVYPVDSKRHYLGRPADAFSIMRNLGLGISEGDYSKFNGTAPYSLSGRILLRVEANGEAYYVNPSDLKMYYLGRPLDAFSVMRNLGLGITNANLNKIVSGTAAPAIETAGPKCLNAECLAEKFTACEPSVSLITLSPSLSYEYIILGEKDGRCEVKTSYPTNPNPEWVGKDMTCLYNNTVTIDEAWAQVMYNLNDASCSGSLTQFFQ